MERGTTVTIAAFSSLTARSLWGLYFLACVAVAVGIVADLGRDGLWGLFALLGIPYGIRALRMGVEATPSALIVRQEFRTEELSWRTIEGFRTSDGWSQNGGGLYALVADAGVVRLPISTRRGAHRRACSVLEAYRARVA